MLGEISVKKAVESADDTVMNKGACEVDAGDAGDGDDAVSDDVDEDVDERKDEDEDSEGERERARTFDSAGADSAAEGTLGEYDEGEKDDGLTKLDEDDIKGSDCLGVAGLLCVEL